MTNSHPRALAELDPKPLTLSEAAAFLNVTERWMRRAVQERRLPYLKLGRHLRFLEQDLQAHIEASRVDPYGGPTVRVATAGPSFPALPAGRTIRSRQARRIGSESATSSRPGPGCHGA